MKYFDRFTLPDFSKLSSILTIIVFTELFAVLISLLTYRDDYLANLGAISIYLNWIVLLMVLILRVLRNTLNKQTGFIPVLGSIACCYFAFILVEISSQYITNKFSFEEFDSNQFLVFSAIALISICIVLRLFAVLALMEERNKSEMSLKVHALQSRIKPHFLFNSLNTISELVVTAPSHAEQAIGSLAMLFRAGLENEQRFYSLGREILLCERYIELEGWRLGERLIVDWNIDIENVDDVRVPKLIVQPLIENAVVHGVQENGNVRISIDIKESKRDVSIVVKNAKSDNQTSNEGHGIAIDNIRERLFVIYDTEQTFKVRENKSEYRVLMRFAKQFINDVG